MDRTHDEDQRFLQHPLEEDDEQGPYPFDGHQSLVYSPDDDWVGNPFANLDVSASLDAIAIVNRELARGLIIVIM